MKENIILALKGFVMGIANVIPGVSGGTLALILGIYERFISSISHFFKNFKENVKFLLPVALGMVIAIVTMSGIITKSFNNFPFPTSTFFMGLVIGGIPLLLGKIKGKKEIKQASSYIIAFLTFMLVMVLAFSEKIFGAGLGDVDLSNLSAIDYVELLIVGMIVSATMVIPGVSGSLVLMLLGYYFPVLNTIKSLMTFQNFWGDVLILGFFGVGVLIGIVLISKLIEFLFSKFEGKTYFGVIGFIIASVIAIPVSVYNELGTLSLSIGSVIAAVITLAVGIVAGYKLGEK